MESRYQQLVGMDHKDLAAYAMQLEIRISRGMSVLEEMGQQATAVLSEVQAIQSRARTVAIRVLTVQQELDGVLPIAGVPAAASSPVPPPMSRALESPRPMAGHKRTGPVASVSQQRGRECSSTWFVSTAGRLRQSFPLPLASSMHFRPRSLRGVFRR